MKADLLKQIRKERESKRFKQPLFYKLAYILEHSERNLENLNLLLSTDDIDNYIEKINRDIEELLIEKTLAIEKKEDSSIAPFYLPSQEVYPKVKSLKEIAEKIATPYFQYANSLEDILLAIPLWVANASIPKELLEKYTFKTLLAGYVAEKLLKEKVKEKKRLEEKINEVEEKIYGIISKELSNALGFDYKAETKEDFVEFFNDYIKKVREEYYKSMIQEKLGIKIEDEIKSRTTLRKIIEKAYQNKKILEMLNISKKDFKVSEHFGSLEKLIEKKLDEFLEGLKMNDEKAEAKLPKDYDLKKLIGKRVRIYPGKGDKHYNFGGTVDDVPAGSEGIVKNICNACDNGPCIYADIPKKAKNWRFAPKEIRLFPEKYSILISKGIDPEVVELIANKDHEKIIEVYKNKKIAELEERLNEIQKHIEYLNEFVGIIRYS